MFAHLYGIEHEKKVGDHLRGDWDMRARTGTGRGSVSALHYHCHPEAVPRRRGLTGEEEGAYDLQQLPGSRTRPRLRSSRVRGSLVSRQPFPSSHRPAPSLTVMCIPGALQEWCWPPSCKTQIKCDIFQRACSGCRSVPLPQTLT